MLYLKSANGSTPLKRADGPDEAGAKKGIEITILYGLHVTFDLHEFLPV